MLVNNQHQVTVEQCTVRLVICEECDADYVYQLTRSGEGYGNSIYFLDESGAKKRAERKAREQLARTMRTAVNAIPCPNCGHYQDHMVPRARFERAFLYLLLGGGTLILTVVFLILGAETRFGNVGYVLGGLFFLATAVIGVITLVIYTSYNPNKKPKSERRALGQEKASLRRDFERDFATSAEDEFEKFCRKLGKKKNRRFELAFWADRGQLKHADTIKLRLPVGEKVSIKLAPNLRDGDAFEYSFDVDGYPIEIACILNLYTKAKV
jgi:hypothetical protein